MAEDHTEKEEYKQLRAQGFRYLRRGLIFLGACLIVGQIAENYEIPLANLIIESAYIAGWVGLWRPMEIFLYDLPDMRRGIRMERSGR